MKSNKMKAGLLPLLSLLLLLSASMAAQQKQTTAQKFQATYKNTNPKNETIFYAFASSPDQTDVNVRATPGGTIVFKLDHNEPGYTVDLYEVWNGWFRISPQIETVDQGPIVLKSKQAWIHGSQLGAGTRNYGGQKLTFRTRPNANSPIVFTINEEIGVSYVDMVKGWIKVKYTPEKSKKSFVGWIETEWLCPNPVTTCP